jgi:hypothetical protein
VGAGVGLAALAAAPRPRGLAALAVAVAGALAWFAAGRGVPDAWALGAGTAALAAATGLPWRLVRGITVAGVLGLAASAILRTPPRDLAMPYTAEAVAIFDEQRSTYEQLRTRLGSDRFWLISPAPASFAITPKQATRHGVRSIVDYEPLNLRRQAEYLTFLHRGRPTPTRANDPFAGVWFDLQPAPFHPPMATRRRLLDLAAVRWILVPPLHRLRPEVGKLLATTGLAQPKGLGPFLMYENPHALPRAFVTYRTLPAHDDVSTLLARLADPGFDPLAASYVEGPAPFTPAADAPARGAPATIVEDGEDRVEVEATLATEGLVVLADTFMQGWTATVDGVAAPIVATNHLFRGVPVPAGTHRIRFTYRPWQIPVGLGTSALALVVVVLLAAPLPRRRAAR